MGRELLWLCLSAAATILSGTQPFFAAAWLQPFFLLRFLDQSSASWRHFLTALPIQALASTLAYGSSYTHMLPVPTAIILATASGVAAWLVLLCPYLLTAAARSRFPKAWISRPFTFAAAWSSAQFAWRSLNPSADLMSPSLSQFCVQPLLLTARLWGIDGINFIMAWCAATTHDRIELEATSCRVEKRHHQMQARAMVAVLLFGLIYGNIPIANRTVVEKPMIDVSCILGAPLVYRLPEVMLNKTKERVEAGDAIVLWSEAAVYIRGKQAETELLSQGAAIARSRPSSTAPGPYIGLTYEFFDEGKRTEYNVFTLLFPNGSIAFRYEKSHLVPVLEKDVTPGEAELPVVDTEFGRVGGAICFDFDFPDFVRQKKLDIMLQPAQTWGSSGLLAFRGDIYRPVENGFTWFRCSVDGITAVVDPAGQVYDYREAVADSILRMQVPISKGVWTFYSEVGFMFPWALVTLATVHLLVACLPMQALKVIGKVVPGRWFICRFTGEYVSEDVEAFFQQLL